MAIVKMNYDEFADIELNVQKGVNKLDFLMNFIGQIKNF